MSTDQQSPVRRPTRSRRDALGFGLLRHSAVKLLVTLCLLFVSEPFVAHLPNGHLVEAVLVTLVMVFAVLAVGGHRRTLILALVLVSPALVGKWLNHLGPDLMPPSVFLAGTVLFFGFVVAQLLRFLVGATKVDANVLSAGVSGFMMLGLLWVPIYLLVDQMTHGAFALGPGADTGTPLDGFNAFYLSFITICTVGFGDVRPVAPVARMLAVLEAVTGMFYMALMMARLVAVYASTQTTPPTKDANEP